MSFGAAGTILILVTCINLVMYFGLNSAGQEFGLVQGDIFSLYLNGAPPQNPTTYLEEGQSKGLNLTSDFSNMPDFQDGGESTGGFKFADALKTVVSITKTLFNVISAPFALFAYGGLPSMVGWVIGLPLSIIYLFGLVSFIRGVTL